MNQRTSPICLWTRSNEDEGLWYLLEVVIVGLENSKEILHVFNVADKEEHGVIPGVTLLELPGSPGPIPGEPGARSDFLAFYVVYQILTEYGSAPLKFERSTQ